VITLGVETLWLRKQIVELKRKQKSLISRFNREVQRLERDLQQLRQVRMENLPGSVTEEIFATPLSGQVMLKTLARAVAREIMARKG
jgi:hypothetical protein